MIPLLLSHSPYSQAAPWAHRDRPGEVNCDSTKTGQKCLTQVALDGFLNIVKEFWPDVNRAIFHGKY
jgi:hypothetical protein